MEKPIVSIMTHDLITMQQSHLQCIDRHLPCPLEEAAFLLESDRLLVRNRKSRGQDHKTANME